jgi:arginyl-tRNA synthetase
LPDAVSRLEARLSELAGAPVELERPNDPAHGDYATNVAMQLAPVQRRSPRELGEELAAAAAGLDEVERTEVAGPGFVNLWLTPAWFGEALGEILAAGPGYGGGSPDEPQQVQVEMVSANPTGPITVASARNGAIGDSVAR